MEYTSIMQIIPAVVDALLGLIKSKQPVFACLGHVQHLLVVTECQSRGPAEASQYDWSDALLLHIYYKYAAFWVRNMSFP